MNEFKDIELFPINAIVDIADIANMQGVRIVSINNSGTAISGEIGAYVTISNKSPARLHIPKPKALIPDIQGGELEEKVVRIKKEPVNYTIPAKPFTIKEFCELNGLQNPIGYLWVKEFCEVVGIGTKPVGQRGKTPSLYSIKK